MLHVCQFMLCMDCESEIKIYYYYKRMLIFVLDRSRNCDRQVQNTTFFASALGWAIRPVGFYLCLEREDTLLPGVRAA